LEIGLAPEEKINFLNRLSFDLTIKVFGFDTLFVGEVPMISG
jgi:hypothetical protein